jgi:hypothetical protein
VSCAGDNSSPSGAGNEESLGKSPFSILGNDDRVEEYQ